MILLGDLIRQRVSSPSELTSTYFCRVLNSLVPKASPDVGLITLAYDVSWTGFRPTHAPSIVVQCGYNTWRRTVSTPQPSVTTLAVGHINIATVLMMHISYPSKRYIVTNES